MLEQGTELVNTDYFDSLIDKINSATNAAELQIYINEAFPSLAAQKTAITAQIKSLAPFLELAKTPSAAVLGGGANGIVSWITKLISASILPQITAYENYAAQMTLLVEKISKLEAAVSNAANKINATSITIPTI